MSNSNKENKPVLVSACLLGVPCRYDGGSKPDEEVREIAKQKPVVPFCPESKGGLHAPRLPAEIQGGDGAAVLDGYARVRDKDGLDVTEQFIKGAEKSVKMAHMLGAEEAILKSKSPSCAVTCIYDGTFSGTLTQGAGVAATALMRAGIKVTEAGAAEEAKDKKKKRKK